MFSVVIVNCYCVLLFIVVVMYCVFSLFTCYIVMPAIVLIIVIWNLGSLFIVISTMHETNLASTMHETNLALLTILGCPPRDRRKLLQLVVY